MNSPEAIVARAFAPLEAAVAAGRIPGGVLGVVDREGRTAVRATGAAQRVPIERPMTAETWFDLASLTKVIFTTPRILALAAAGRIDLDAPLTTVLPDFRQYNADNWERKITFRQCLGHQTPFPAVFPLYTYGRDPELLRAFVLQHEWPAGPSVYSDINFILLGLALERLEGQLHPRHRPGAGLCLVGRSRQRRGHRGLHLAPPRAGGRGARRQLRGPGGGRPCRPLRHRRVNSRFRARPARRHRSIRRLMRTPVSARRTHGWERPYEGWSGGERAAPETLGHTGFTGTGLWVDFAAGRAWTLLTNRIHPTRHADSRITELRRAVGDLVNA